jgi:hypothetical protein
LLLLLIGACAQLPTEPPRLNVVSLEPEEMTLLEQKFRIRIRIQNPNDAEIRVNGLSYKLELNDGPLLSGVGSSAFVVPRFGEAVIEVSGGSTIQPAFLTKVRGETVQGRAMAGFRDRGSRRRSRHYVEQPDRAKARQGMPWSRRSRSLVRNAGYACFASFRPFSGTAARRSRIDSRAS